MNGNDNTETRDELTTENNYHAIDAVPALVEGDRVTVAYESVHAKAGNRQHVALTITDASYSTVVYAEDDDGTAYSLETEGEIKKADKYGNHRCIGTVHVGGVLLTNPDEPTDDDRELLTDGGRDVDDDGVDRIEDTRADVDDDADALRDALENAGIENADDFESGRYDHDVDDDVRESAAKIGLPDAFRERVHNASFEYLQDILSRADQVYRHARRNDYYDAVTVEHRRRKRDYVRDEIEARRANREYHDKREGRDDDEDGRLMTDGGEDVRPPSDNCPHCGGSVEKESHEDGHDWICQTCGMNLGGVLFTDGGQEMPVEPGFPASNQGEAAGEHTLSHGSHRSVDCVSPKECPGYAFETGDDEPVPTTSDLIHGNPELWPDTDHDDLPCFACYRSATFECEARVECDGCALSRAGERKRGTCTDCHDRLVSESIERDTL